MNARRAIARKVDRWVFDRAAVLAGRAARGTYDEDTNHAILSSVQHAAAPAVRKQPSPEYVEAVAAALEGLWDRSTGRIVPSARLRTAVVDEFHRVYYHSSRSTWLNTFYRGVPIWKCPLDLWLYQEIIYKVKPDLVVETGTAYGGSACFLADLCEAMGRGQVVTIDVKTHEGHVYPEHPRLTYLLGSSTDTTLKDKALGCMPADGSTVLVILDSSHRRRHVLNEMRLWHDTVPVGSYMIVEDSNLNGHPAQTRFGPGPWEAIEAFLKERPEFVVDESMHKFLMTLNPRGYLRRIS